MEEEINENIVDIRPLGKGKRILAFLGDLFITFFLSFALFNLALFPLAKLIVDAPSKSQQISALEKQANTVLLNSKLIYENPNDDHNFLKDVDYTFKVFLSYYTDVEDINNPQFGHKAENEVIYHYLAEIKGDEASYFAAFKEENFDGFFEVGETKDSVFLKKEYKAILAAELKENKSDEEFSENMKKIRDNVFARLFYIHVYNDIQKVDLVVDGISYNKSVSGAVSINETLKWMDSISAIVTVIFSTSITYLLIPLIRKDHRTIGLLMMKVYRTNKKTFSYSTRLEVVVQYFYHMIYNLSYAIFLPILLFGVAFCFYLPILFHFFFIGFLLMFASMFFIIFNEFSRSIMDIATQSILIPEDELDNLYKID